MGWSVALALAVLLGAVLSYDVAGSPHARPVSLKDSCGADVLFLGARGSGEKPDDASLGFGATLFSAYHAMSTAYRPRNVVAEPVEYAAVSVPDAVRSGMTDYTSSLSAGFDNLQAKLGNWSDKCPNYRFVLAGYSQGADVVGDVLADLAASKSARAGNILSRIVGVALFGDPRYNPADPVDVNPPTPDREGIFATLPAGQGGIRPEFPMTLRSRVGSWCLANDIICNTAPGISILSQAVGCVPSGACAHYHYADWGVSAEAGRWLAQRANTELNPGAATANPPTAGSAATPPIPTATHASTSASSAPPPTVSALPISPTPPTPSSPQTQPQPPPPGPGQIPSATDPGQTPLPAGARRLGGVDLNQYCSNGWGLHAVLRFPNTWGWRCSPSTVPAAGNRIGDQYISVDDACAQQYGSGAKSHYGDYNDPNSWFCWILS
jgi:hypothetical protein